MGASKAVGGGDPSMSKTFKIVKKFNFIKNYETDDKRNGVAWCSNGVAWYCTGVAIPLRLTFIS